MKIAFVVDRYGNRYGGAEAYGVELMRVLAKDHDITVFAREYDSGCGVSLPFVPIRSGSRWPSWVRVLIFAWRARQATRSGYDIVHSHMNGWCGDIEVVHVTPVRYNWRVRPLSWHKRWLSYISLRVQTYLGLEARRVAQRPGHRTVAVSGLIADQLKQAYGLQFATTVIPPGVVQPAVASAEQRLQIRHDLGFIPDDQVCLLVARNPLRKGLPTVLQALELLPEHVKLMVVGSNAASRDYIYKSSRYQSLAHRIKLVEETSNVAPYYIAADTYVHPTLNDSFGMAPLEAMSFGLPVILSPTPWCGFAQYVQDKHSALVLSHPENFQQLAEYIGQLNDHPELRQQLLQGAEHVVKQHSWAYIAQQYQALYDAVLAEKSSVKK
ncbi:glycosyltransferase family 4 protein [Alcaligenaceae bacterium]|nr:glycosyltransferase family 4 protein [Alcaligenaceae bacterium]